MDEDVLQRLDRRLGPLHAKQRLGIETDHEAQIFGHGLNFFHIENWKTQSVMTGMLAALIAASLFLIWAQNQPFRGPVHVSPGAYAHGIEQLHAIDLGQSGVPSR